METGNEWTRKTSWLVYASYGVIYMRPLQRGEDRRKKMPKKGIEENKKRIFIHSEVECETSLA